MRLNISKNRKCCKSCAEGAILDYASIADNGFWAEPRKSSLYIFNKTYETG